MLGLDDKLIIVLGIVALLVLFRIVFWLHKIYNRVRGISQDLGHIAKGKVND